MTDCFGHPQAGRWEKELGIYLKSTCGLPVESVSGARVAVAVAVAVCHHAGGFPSFLNM